jgi:[CysO sulfur-carrier protein]-S-L-cysteine hydrolase
LSVKITLNVLAGIVRHARDVAPMECCGLLAGKDDLIDEYIRTANTRASEVTYQVDPIEHISAIKSLRVRGRSVLGAYHSHPRTAAVPSATDVAEAHYEGNFLYLIVSLGSEPPDIRGYRLTRQRLEAADFEAVP